MKKTVLHTVSICKLWLISKFAVKTSLKTGYICDIFSCRISLDSWSCVFREQGATKQRQPLVNKKGHFHPPLRSTHLSSNTFTSAFHICGKITKCFIASEETPPHSFIFDLHLQNLNITAISISLDKMINLFQFTDHTCHIFSFFMLWLKLERKGLVISGSWWKQVNVVTFEKDGSLTGRDECKWNKV